MATKRQQGVKHSAVDHPAHYNVGQIEVIDAIEDWGLGFDLGNAVKYIVRAGRKSGDAWRKTSALEDLQKAEWYVHRAIQRLRYPGLTSKEAQAKERVLPRGRKPRRVADEDC